MPHGHKAGSEVVNTTGENGTEGDPQEHAGAPHCAAHSTPDGAQASNVQQLNQEDPPGRHDDIVNAVLHGNSGGLTVVRTEGLGYESAIDKVSADEKCQAYEETNHILPSLQFGAPRMRNAFPNAERECWRIPARPLYYSTFLVKCQQNIHNYSCPNWATVAV